jgi:hypothetical protein
MDTREAVVEMIHFIFGTIVGGFAFYKLHNFCIF